MWLFATTSCPFRRLLLFLPQQFSGRCRVAEGYGEGYSLRIITTDMVPHPEKSDRGGTSTKAWIRSVLVDDVQTYAYNGTLHLHLSKTRPIATLFRTFSKTRSLYHPGLIPGLTHSSPSLPTTTCNVRETEETCTGFQETQQAPPSYPRGNPVFPFLRLR